MNKKALLPKVLAFAVIASFAALIATTAMTSNAQIDVDTGSQKITGVSTSRDLKGEITRIINYGLGFAGLVAVIFLIYGGVQYIIAGGDQDTMDKAKNTIIYAIIGLVIILLAFVVVSAVGRILA